MNIMDLDSAINILETYMADNKGKADYLNDVISELKNVYDEMDRYARKDVSITILPWDNN